MMLVIIWASFLHESPNPKPNARMMLVLILASILHGSELVWEPELDPEVRASG